MELGYQLLLSSKPFPALTKASCEEATVVPQDQLEDGMGHCTSFFFSLHFRQECFLT